MKKFLLALSLAALTAGFAGTSYAFNYSSCANNNSQHCVDARNAFAEHHGGQCPVNITTIGMRVIRVAGTAPTTSGDGKE